MSVTRKLESKARASKFDAVSDMATEKFIIFLCTLSGLCCVTCDLNLPEDSSCDAKDGFNGTCRRLFNCNSASLTHLYLAAGFEKGKNFPDLPEICSYKDNEPVVCCTDCVYRNNTFRDYAVLPFGYVVKKKGPVAGIKCLEYFQRLPYKCHGVGNVGVDLAWNETGKCFSASHHASLSIGGRDAQRWEFPHVALIGYGDDVKNADWLCGGSVISERFILTAAHCKSTKALGNITYAALGLLKRTDPKKYWKTYRIQKIIVHPEYKPPSKYHDIALLETKTEINFGRDLLPACLDLGLDLYNQYSAEASGWGRLGYRSLLADTLQAVKLERFEESECADMYKPHRLLKNGYDHKSQMCYGSKSEIVDTCEGDSGGPLQTNMFKCLYTVIGVTSYGKECGILGSAGMYTRVSYYVPWIESVVWPEETEARRIQDNQWLDKWLN